VSPKGTFFVVDDKTIAFGEIRSPSTIRNLRMNARIEINFVDPFVRKGYRFAGTAIVVERGTDTFDTLLGRYLGALGPRMRAIVVITVIKALPLTSPVYDDGNEWPAEAVAPAGVMDEAYHPAKDRVVIQFEKEYLTRLISRAGGNMSKAARLASIDRTTLYRLMDKHEFQRDDSPGPTA